MEGIEVRNQIIDKICDVVELRNKITKLILNIIEQMDNEVEEEFDETIRDKIVDFVIDKMDNEDDDELFDLVHKVVYKVYEKLVGFWETLKYDDDYEINTKYPYQIRKRGCDIIINEREDNNGYIMIRISGRNTLKHRLIAIQWIDNDIPTTKIQIDHIDRNKLNNHISNLRWVTAMENAKNRSKMKRQIDEYIEELPEDAFEITEYNDYEFERYYFDKHGNRILLRTFNNAAKIIKPYIDGNRKRVALYDINRKRCKFHYNKLMEYLRHNY